MKRFIKIFLLGLLFALLSACGAEGRKQAYFDRGMELLEEGDIARARLEFKNVLQIDPKHARAWYELAEIEATQQNWGAAFGAYGKAVELDPQNLQARVKRGQLLFDSGQLEDALADIEAVLAVDPENPDALALRGAVQARRGELKAAVLDVEAALAIEPRHRNGLLLLAQIRRAQNDREEAKRLLEEAIQAHPRDAQLRLVLAGLHQEAGDSAAARVQLEQLVAMEPGQLLHLARLVGFLTEEGWKDEAEEALRRALTADPEQYQTKLMLVEWSVQQRGLEPGLKLLEDFVAAEPDVFPLRFALAELYRAADRDEAARSAYRAIIELDELGPQGRRARGRLAALLLAGGRQDEAETLVAEVLKEDPRDVDSLLVRATIALGRKDADRAVADLRDALHNDPGSTRALRLLARAHVMREETALAQDALEKAIETSPDDPLAYLELAQLRVDTGDMAGASATLERFLDRVPDNSLVQSALARIQLSQEDWQAMERTAARIRESQPDHPLGYYLEGLILQRAGELAESVRAFEMALEKRPDAVEPLLALAKSHLALEQPDQAETRLQQLLVAQPANAAALNLLGEVYASTGRFPEAFAQFRQVIAMNPSSPNAYARLAELQVRSGDLDAAAETLRSGVEATDRNAFLVFRLGMALQDLGRYDASIEAYGEVLETNPQADAVVNNLAMLLVNHRADDPASLARARELTQRFEGSDQWVLLDTLGWVQFRNGATDRAQVTLEKAASLVDPLPPEMQYHLGMLYDRLGRHEEARTLLADALNANRPFPGIQEARETLEAMSGE